MTAPSIAIGAYRDAVDDLMIELAAHRTPGDARKVTRILTERLVEREFSDLFAATPHGVEATQRMMIAEAEAFRPNGRSSAIDRAALIRIYLLAQIDTIWWGHSRPYTTDLDVESAADLVAIDAMPVEFRYRRQANTLPVRAWRAAERRIASDRRPRTAGLRFTQARPAVVELINQLAIEFRTLAPAGTPRLWVNSITRSVGHQHRLRALGYAAILPSSHCTGYAVDLEMNWYRRYGAHAVLQRLLTEHRDAGRMNVIDEGQAWHICVSPTVIGSLLDDFALRTGG
jgi:Family of unknown function (DUF5715)